MGQEASSCGCCAKATESPPRRKISREESPVVVGVDAKKTDARAGESEGEAEEFRLAPNQRGRRAGVAAQSVDNNAVKDYKKPVYQKDAASKQRIQDVLRKNEKMQVLFGHVKEHALNDVIDAFFPKTAVQGETLIKQGEEGDCLYIVDDGTVDVYVARAGDDGKVRPGDRGSKVVTLGKGALFGELALMYSAPRAATVVAAAPQVKLWALAQEPFKMLLAQSSQNQYALYEGWLSEVDIFKTLNQFELSKLSDLLESNLYSEGEVIITQGEVGDRFFLVEDGECAAYISGPQGEKQVKVYKKQGEYFGELALLNEEPRKATVRATGQGCALVSMTKEDFDNVLGPVKDILKKSAGQYTKYAEFLK